MNSIDNRFESFPLLLARFPDAVPRRGRLFQRRRLRGSKTKVIIEENNAGEDQNNANIHKRQTIYYSDKPDSSSDGRTMTIPSGNNNGFFDDIFQVEKRRRLSILSSKRCFRKAKTV